MKAAKRLKEMETKHEAKKSMHKMEKKIERKDKKEDKKMMGNMPMKKHKADKY